MGPRRLASPSFYVTKVTWTNGQSSPRLFLGGKRQFWGRAAWRPAARPQDARFLFSRKTKTLFITQGDHGIHPHGSASGKIAGQQGHGQQDNCTQNQRRGIIGSHSVKLALEKSRQPERRQQPCGQPERAKLESF